MTTLQRLSCAFIALAYVCLMTRYVLTYCIVRPQDATLALMFLSQVRLQGAEDKRSQPFPGNRRILNADDLFQQFSDGEEFDRRLALVTCVPDATAFLLCLRPAVVSLVSPVMMISYGISTLLTPIGGVGGILAWDLLPAAAAFAGHASWRRSPYRARLPRMLLNSGPLLALLAVGTMDATLHPALWWFGAHVWLSPVLSATGLFHLRALPEGTSPSKS